MLFWFIMSGFLVLTDPMSFELKYTIHSAVALFMIGVLSICFYKNRENIISVVLNKKDYVLVFFFSICMTLGYGLIRGYGFDVFCYSYAAIMFSVVTVTYYALFASFLLRFLYSKVDCWMEDGKEKEQKKLFGIPSWLYDKYMENNIFVYFVVLLVSWFPILLIYFPGMLMQDGVTQILQYFHLPNMYTDFVVLLDPNQYITNQHSVVLTLFIGKTLELGKFLFGSLDAGIFLYILIQFLSIAFAVAYLLKVIRPYMGSRGTFVFLLIFALNPFFGIFSILMTKDIYFCVFFILYGIKYFELIKEPKKINDKRFFVSFLLISVLLPILRRNAFVSILITSLFMFIYIQRKRTVLLYTSLFIMLFFAYSNVLLPAMNITVSPKGGLSIPFQQTAYYVVEHEEEVTEKEKEVIGKILDYEHLVDYYNPDLSDPVKDTYNKYATKEELAEYFNVWFQMLWKHPGTYVKAFIHQTYGYYFPSVKKTVNYNYMNDDYSRQIAVDAGLPLNEVKEPSVFKMLVFVYNLFAAYCPFVCLISDTGFYLWILLFMCIYILNRFADKRKYLMYYVPFFAYYVFLVACPVNGMIYVRYIIPLMYTLPMMLLPLFLYKQEKKEK